MCEGCLPQGKVLHQIDTALHGWVDSWEAGTLVQIVFSITVSVSVEALSDSIYIIFIYPEKETSL